MPSASFGLSKTFYVAFGMSAPGLSAVHFTVFSPVPYVVPSSGCACVPSGRSKIVNVGFSASGYIPCIL